MLILLVLMFGPLLAGMFTGRAIVGKGKGDWYVFIKLHAHFIFDSLP
jgi:hypothetical protein